ncbi:MAG: DUF692 family protein [Leptospirales bacterium]|nr:DUF692 family protein [Leptospirales bacterium]
MAEVPDAAVAAAEDVGVVVEADKFGLGFRPELAGGILAHQDEIDVLEVIAEDLFKLRREELDTFRILANSFDLALHGVSLGMASSHNVDSKRLDSMARLVQELNPAHWSEHLAFVRAGGHEIGHLAAPPRTDSVIQGTLANLSRARRSVGSRPLLENIATLIDPPMSDYSETEWIRTILLESDCDLLLDLHNLYANAVNFGMNPFDMLEHIPASRIKMVHLSGGMWIEHSTTEKRLLDDHLHDPPEIVYDLLEEVARRAPTSLNVVIERDGAYPEMGLLLQQLRLARTAVARGRSRMITRQEINV